MSFHHAPKIITDGLIMLLDAGNPKSYPKLGNMIYDISGFNNHHEIINSPTFNDTPARFSLNGIDQGFTRNSNLNGATSNMTVIIFYNTLDATELWCMGNNNGGYYLSASSGNNYYHGNCIGIGGISNFVDLKSVVNPVTEGYRNGKYHMWEAKNVDFITTEWTSFKWFSYSGSWFLNGDITSILIYNRVLSADESKSIFLTNKKRFDI